MKHLSKIIALFFAAVFPVINGVENAPQPKETTAEFIERTYSECAAEEVRYTESADFAPDGDFSGIKAITFDGFEIGGEKTKIFAYLAFPENADESTPAVVLVHGGGGHAYLEWVKQWLDAGYSVIAPDVTGFFPTAKNAGVSTSDDLWAHALGAFNEDGYTVIPDNDGMANSAESPENQWMYHAVGAVIRSFSILERSGKASPDKIGVVGISWGAVITSLYIGYDGRCAFAVPIYGSAYLGESLAYMKNMFADGETSVLWSAEDRLDKVTCPVLWLCSDCDGNFSVNSSSDSYIATSATPGTRLSIVASLAHSHESAWERKEPLVFADSIVNGGNELPTVKLSDEDNVLCTADGATRARLYYLTKELTYSLTDEENPCSTMPDQQWIKASLNLVGGNITGEIPSDAVMYFISATGDGCTVSTPIIRIGE